MKAILCDVCKTSITEGPFYNLTVCRGSVEWMQGDTTLPHRVLNADLCEEHYKEISEYMRTMMGLGRK